MIDRKPEIQRSIPDSPIRRMFATMHGDEELLDVHSIDEVLGLPPLGDDQESFAGKSYILTPEGRNEYVLYQGTDYNLIRQGVRWINPDSSDVVYDLGSGYGRFCLYGALTTDARWKGIEIVQPRVEVAQSAQRRLELPNAEFIQGNVAEQDLTDGTVFYIYNSLSSETLEEVLGVLQDLSTKKSIRILSHWTWYTHEIPSWLKVLEEVPDDPFFMLAPK